MKIFPFSAMDEGQPTRPARVPTDEGDLMFLYQIAVDGLRGAHREASF
jgi:hypothetical protein